MTSNTKQQKNVKPYVLIILLIINLLLLFFHNKIIVSVMALYFVTLFVIANIVFYILDL